MQRQSSNEQDGQQQHACRACSLYVPVQLGMQRSPVSELPSCLLPLQGEGGDHLQLRQRVMGYVEEREEEYKFFM